MFVLAGEILVILGLIVLNGALAGSELALVSAQKSRLASRAEAGEKGATVALELSSSLNRFLSTVQIGITLIGITAGAWGATAVASTLAAGLTQLGMVPGRASALSFGFVVASVTFLTLVLGELVPKRLALRDPEGFAVRVARPMRALAAATTPFVHLLSWSTDLVLRLLPWHTTIQPTVTEDEIERLVAEATAAGILEKTEQDVVRRIFRLSDLTVEALMTPRERIVWLDLKTPPKERRKGIVGVGHSRFVVCDGELDRVLGYVKVQDVLASFLEGGEPDLAKELQKPHLVRPWTTAFHLLEMFQRSGDHIAIVLDASGRVQGLVTLNDILENIVGDFPEPHEFEVPGAVRRTDGSWLVDGLLSLEAAMQILGRTPAEASRFPTMHAFMVHHLGTAPAPADTFEWEGLRLEVVDMDGSRVDKVLIQTAGVEA